MTDSSPDRTLVITFTDLIYAALAAFGLGLVGTALDHHNAWAVAYLAAGGVWLFYDWYANHYFVIEQQLGGRNIPLDAVSLAQYAGLLYAASKTSPWILFFLAIRGIRGIVYNELALRREKRLYDPERLRSYNYSSGFMAMAYTVIFLDELKHKTVDVDVQLGLAVGIWLIAYGIALRVEARLDRRRATQGDADQAAALTGGGLDTAQRSHSVGIPAWAWVAIVITVASRLTRGRHRSGSTL